MINIYIYINVSFKVDHTSLHTTHGLKKWTDNLEDAACDRCFFIDTTTVII